VTDFDEILQGQIDGIPDEELLEDIKQLIRLAESERPRSLQKVPGPSEVGHPCMRRLAYGIHRARSTQAVAQGQNHYNDPLAAIMGTAMHAWLEEAARAANKRLGRTRWVPEQRVVVRPQEVDLENYSAESCHGPTVLREELAGTCDLYDYDTKGVLDWKVPGATRYAHYVKHGPSEVYRGQAHLYGKGYINLGFEVETVGIVFISRTGTMKQMHLWREPYNPELVEEILSRLDDVEERMQTYDVASNPSGFLRLPIVPGDDCRFCNWWSPQPQGPFQCEGKS
jgi:hypothetical protein